MPKGRIYLYTTAFFYCLKTLISWFAITWPGFHVSKRFFFSQSSSQNLYENIIKFLAEGETFILAYLHGRRDVSYKPAIQQTSSKKSFWNVPCKTRTSAIAKIEYSFWFVYLASPHNFKPRVSCGLVVLQYDKGRAPFALTNSSLVVGTFFTGENGENEEWYNKLHSWKPV